MSRKTKERIYPETIIIERMYAGEYLDDNIGHEIINTIKTDKGENYIYITPHGIINSDKRNVKHVLLVRLISQHSFQVLGYASDLELLITEECFGVSQREAELIDSENQQNIIKNNQICYGGIAINDLLSEQEGAVFVTFKAGVVRFAKENLYIVDDVALSDELHLFVPMVFSKQSLKMYIDEKSNNTAFHTVEDIIMNESFWDKTQSSETVNTLLSVEKTDGILDIIRKNDDELAYSNWIAYYLKNDLPILGSFIREVLQIKKANTQNAKIIREYHNIDIWIESEDYVIVIENKVKAGINGVRQDKHDLKGYISSQLSKYKSFADDYCKRNKRTVYYYIFLPDYSYSADDLRQYLCGGEYTLIRYSQLAEFFKNHKSNLPYYGDFVQALIRHSSIYRNDLRKEMENRFIKAIKAKHTALNS